MNIQEDYVSFEIAKLLKEKGFDDSCCRFVVEPDGTYHRGEPSLGMTMKWFREVHKIFICILFINDSNYYGYTIESLTTKEYLATSGNTPYDSYEKACEAALKYSLENLI